MLKIKQIHALFILMLMLILSSCRTATISPAWGLCGYEDPVNECEWMRKIIRQHRTKRMQIAEVVAEMYIEKDSLIEKTDELMYAYQIDIENDPNCHDCFRVTSYDCNGNRLLEGGYIAGMSPLHVYKDSLYINCKIIDYNIIYNQGY